MQDLIAQHTTSYKASKTSDGSSASFKKHHRRMSCALCHTGIQTPQLKLGQSYLCMSLDTDNLNTVAQVVAGEGVIVFGSDMAGISNLPDVKAITDGPGPSERLPCHCTECSAPHIDIPSQSTEQRAHTCITIRSLHSIRLQDLLEVKAVMKPVAWAVRQLVRAFAIISCK